MTLEYDEPTATPANVRTTIYILIPRSITYFPVSLLISGMKADRSCPLCVLRYSQRMQVRDHSDFNIGRRDSSRGLRIGIFVLRGCHDLFRWSDIDGGTHLSIERGSQMRLLIVSSLLLAE